jgi:hypothetical protein
LAFGGLSLLFVSLFWLWLLCTHANMFYTV